MPAAVFQNLSDCPTGFAAVRRQAQGSRTCPPVRQVHSCAVPGTGFQTLSNSRTGSRLRGASRSVSGPVQRPVRIRGGLAPAAAFQNLSDSPTGFAGTWRRRWCSTRTCLRARPVTWYRGASGGVPEPVRQSDRFRGTKALTVVLQNLSDRFSQRSGAGGDVPEPVRLSDGFPVAVWRRWRRCRPVPSGFVAWRQPWRSKTCPTGGHDGLRRWPSRTCPTVRQVSRQRGPSRGAWMLRPGPTVGQVFRPRVLPG